MTPPEWPNRISDRPLKSAIKKLTSRAPIASASAPASASTAVTGGAASTAASNEFKFSGDRRPSAISPNLAPPFAKHRVVRPVPELPNTCSPGPNGIVRSHQAAVWHAARLSFSIFRSYSTSARGRRKARTCGQLPRHRS
jgi:hypothetical protein